MKDYYQVLGIDPRATNEEIKKAYRLYATKFHPDKQNGDKFFEERFKEIQEAYEILSDTNKKSNYDLKFQNSKSNYQQYKEPHISDEDLKRTEQELKKMRLEIKKANLEFKKNEEERKRKEYEYYLNQQELNRKEQQIQYEKSQQIKEARLKKEFQLRQKIYYNKFNIYIDGCCVRYNNIEYNFINCNNARFEKISNPKAKNTELNIGCSIFFLIFGLILLIVNILIGIIITGLGIILISTSNSKNNNTGCNIILDSITSNSTIIIIATKSIAIEVVKHINTAIQIYHST